MLFSHTCCCLGRCFSRQAGSNLWQQNYDQTASINTEVAQAELKLGNVIAADVLQQEQELADKVCQAMCSCLSCSVARWPANGQSLCAVACVTYKTSALAPRMPFSLSLLVLSSLVQPCHQHSSGISLFVRPSPGAAMYHIAFSSYKLPSSHR